MGGEFGFEHGAQTATVEEAVGFEDQATQRAKIAAGHGLGLGCPGPRLGQAVIGIQRGAVGGQKDSVERAGRGADDHVGNDVRFQQGPHGSGLKWATAAAAGEDECDHGEFSFRNRTRMARIGRICTDF